MFIDEDTIAVELGKKVFLEFSDSEKAFLTRTITAVESVISKYYVDLSGAATRTEYLPISHGDNGSDYDLVDVDFAQGRMSDRPSGTGTNALILSSTPVLSAGLEVREDISANGGQASGAFPDSTLLTKGEDYYLEIDEPASGRSRCGILRRVGALWPNISRSVKVTYVCGSLAISASDSALITNAICMSVASQFRFWKSTFNVSKGGAPVSSESIGKYSYSVGSGNRAGSMGNEFGGFGPLLPDEIAASIAHLYNWGNVI